MSLEVSLKDTPLLCQFFKTEMHCEVLYCQVFG